MKVKKRTAKAGGRDPLQMKTEFDGLKRLSEALLPWFQQEQRKMPWRDDPTPYHVWVSEIMLQQTRVDTVIPYYLRFMEALPDVRALAEAPEDRLYKLYEGLGYYSRVRHMKAAAEEIVGKYGGVFPDSEEALLKLPGIGAYTAGAVLSIAMEKPCPVVDGNVLRVYSRILGDGSNISEEATKKRFAAVLRDFLERSGVRPSLFNQGLMELGALVCLPNGAPLCDRCPAAAFCAARLQDRIASLPYKSGKAARRIEEKTVFLISRGSSLLIGKRPETGLLAGLYGLPEAKGFLTEAEAAAFLSECGVRTHSLKQEEEKKHIFTHIEWRMRAFRAEAAETDEEKLGNSGCFFADAEEIRKDYALPGAFRKWDFFE